MLRSTGLRSVCSASVAVIVLAGCSDNVMLGPSDQPGPSFVAIQAVPLPADVIVGTGSWSVFTPTEGGPEFWDNTSTDGTNCNVGFYVLGTIPSGCGDQQPGSYLNAGGGYNEYWNDGSDGPSAFMFNGAYQYTVILKGSYAYDNTQEVGWFTESGGTYTFNPVAGWGSLVVNTSVQINTGGADWGFYYRNNFNDTNDGCAPGGPPYWYCSDADGTAQQFALFLNTGNNSYFVGVEDNTLAPPGDSDYNDIMFSITVDEVAGCTLTQGYWKTHSAGRKYNPTWALVGGPNAPFFNSGMTWIQIFNTSAATGNDYVKLAYQYMAAKLNVYAGASTTPAVVAAILGAEAYFTAQGAGVFVHQSADAAAYQVILGQYNEGLIGPGHCD